MAYVDTEHGWFTPVQSDLNWAQTFRMTLRAPAIANRIFDTLEHAQAYINDYSDKASAVPGIILCVTSDSNIDNNGMWLVLSVKDSSSAAAGTMRRIDERTVFNVTNLTTDLAKYTTPGIYFFTNTTTGKGYVMFVEKNSDNETIQTLMNSSGYQYRTGSNSTPPVWENYTSRTYLIDTDVDTALSDSSANPVQNKAVTGAIEQLKNKIVSQTGNATIQPNMLNVWDTAVTALTITKGTDLDDELNHYFVRLKVGIPAEGESIQITFAGFSLKWHAVMAPIWVSGKTYEISIINNFAIWAEF